MKDIDKDIATAAMAAVHSPREWESVLELIIDKSPAVAAIITLRDKENCQIINDDALETKFHSPLVRGFPMEAVVYYLTELRTIDPWAAYQRSHYPLLPMCMSRECPPESVADQRFFNWLRSGGIEDTVVFELDRMSGYWTACNLFLPSRAPEQQNRMMEFAQRHHDFLRSAWQAGQALGRQRQSGQATINQFTRFGIAAGIVGANGELREANARLDDMISDGSVRVSGARRRISFAHGAVLEGLDAWEDIRIARHEHSAGTYHVSAVPIEPDPLYHGKRENLWLLTIVSQRPQSSDIDLDEADLSGLTRQERDLLLAVRSGLGVSDAGARIGVRRTRAFDIWGSVKDKLGIMNAHQIRQGARP